jgi:hypothetical protein
VTRAPVSWVAPIASSEIGHSDVSAIEHTHLVEFITPYLRRSWGWSPHFRTLNTKERRHWSPRELPSTQLSIDRPRGEGGALQLQQDLGKCARDRQTSVDDRR